MKEKPSTNPHFAQVFFSCTHKKSSDGEQFIQQHVLDYIMAGTGETYFNGKRSTYQAGDFRFVRRNRITKFVKHPPLQGEYQSVSICIDEETLRSLQHEQKSVLPTPGANDNVVLLKPHKLLTSYIASLTPYLEDGARLNPALVRMKVKEAVMLLLETNPQLSPVLFDLSAPGKIDLAAYMEAHYRYNGSLENFAYLTGRSLSTFKRDFVQIFNTTPNKWLLEKRLQDAHYLLQKKHWKATDVYIEVGFKDYSHFSVAFKKQFGSSPSSL